MRNRRVIMADLALAQDEACNSRTGIAVAMITTAGETPAGATAWRCVGALTRMCACRRGRATHWRGSRGHVETVVRAGKERQRVTIIITDDDVKRLLPMPDCIEAMRVAFRDFSDGSAVNRPRMRYLAQHPDPGRKYLANVHVGAVPSAGIACVRAGSQIIRPPGAGNDRRLYENPQAFNWGIVILYSIETAEPLALMHEFQLSGMRVGATTAVGIDQVARPDAATLGLFGTGKQARCALEAIAVVRPLRRVNVYSPSA